MSRENKNNFMLSAFLWVIFIVFFKRFVLFLLIIELDKIIREENGDGSAGEVYPPRDICTKIGGETKENEDNPTADTNCFSHKETSCKRYI